jgi:hypothetical protein
MSFLLKIANAFGSNQTAQVWGLTAVACAASSVAFFAIKPIVVGKGVVSDSDEWRAATALRHKNEKSLFVAGN